MRVTHRPLSPSFEEGVLGPEKTTELYARCSNEEQTAGVTATKSMPTMHGEAERGEAKTKAFFSVCKGHQATVRGERAGKIGNQER